MWRQMACVRLVGDIWNKRAMHFLWLKIWNSIPSKECATEHARSHAHAVDC